MKCVVATVAGLFSAHEDYLEEKTNSEDYLEETTDYEFKYL